MKEYENLEFLKKKFSPLLYIFRKDDENEIKKYLKKCTFAAIIKKYKSSCSSNEYENTMKPRPSIFMKNLFPNYFENPTHVFNKFYGNDISEKGKFLSTKDAQRNSEVMTYSHNSILNKNILNSKYFPHILNNNVVRCAEDEDLDLDELEKEYIVVKKVYSFVQEGPSFYMYIY
ncbi:hypothetical protein MKS88_000897 [Plasmodium brasilianum]|uniref:Uncharacterized protein n=2 Tax=Plasmodium (Plasmodium) TaxID=418103 RepID=A0A1A8X046_PLAMA|nr:conserved Plasmodium protein, unknown function [Plasmodium malariae]KAI4840664.1 hypothetical protein MKS88_000897 [Plasmodium brasilianum]SBS97044.1 conserved Plasmodium protein, unknown function [Plasmodium malariae]SBT86228.1 conserved Plasmodium protein, unknown function [Plasmodium malariae]